VTKINGTFKRRFLKDGQILVAAHFQHQLINPFDETGRVIKLTAFGQQSLVKQH
jgi:hypothetical protein